MMRKPTTTDGFVIPRRPRSTSNPRVRLDRPATNTTGLRSSAPTMSLPSPTSNSPVKSTAPKSTLPDLEALPPTGLTGKKAKKKGFRFRKPSKRTVKWIIIIILLIALAVGGYFVYKFISNSGKVFKGNPITAILSQGKDLKIDQHGRSNILLFGTSEDDPEHDGANLTDSIMLVSIDQKKKDAFLISIPRDLYVDYGKACPSGYKGKINVVYLCSQEESGEDAGQEAIRAKVGDVLGLDVQYSVHLNDTVLREAVDAVGGITVKIESQDPRGILDRNFDWDCPNGNSTCYNVKYPNGDAALNGKQALYLARARGADPMGRTYGLPQANFDRENYQRKILIALKDKAASIGTLANPVAVTKLLDALGNNVRTNFDAEEIKTLVKFGNEVKNESIKSISLVDKEKPLVTTGNVGGESIVRPIPGIYDYSQIQQVVLAYATGDTFSLENAVVDVMNASGVAGAAQTKADELAKIGFKIGKVATAPEALNTAPVQIFDNSKGSKPGTLEKLKKTYNVTPTEGLPAGVTSTADFVIVIGAAPANAQ